MRTYIDKDVYMLDCICAYRTLWMFHSCTWWRPASTNWCSEAGFVGETFGDRSSLVLLFCKMGLVYILWTTVATDLCQSLPGVPWYPFSLLLQNFHASTSCVENLFASMVLQLNTCLAAAFKGELFKRSDSCATPSKKDSYDPTILS